MSRLVMRQLDNGAFWQRHPEDSQSAAGIGIFNQMGSVAPNGAVQG